MEKRETEIRRVREGDAGALLAFYNSLGPGSKRMFRPLGDETILEECEKIIADNRAGIETKYDLVATEGGRVVGWAFLWEMDCGMPTFGLAVADSHRGQGLGSRLMDAVIEAGRAAGKSKVVLTVVQDNEKARRMYERRGFVRTGETVGEHDGLPYYVMEAHIGAEDV
ncbi:MAG: GNAT family N-acetyltransferase [Candidatus Hydrogenedentes bacterium]|nr:GNAT family N-acetyltransferase [Candidatus Hydrogenedentota bacterium]